MGSLLAFLEGFEGGALGVEQTGAAVGQPGIDVLVGDSVGRPVGSSESIVAGEKVTSLTTGDFVGVGSADGTVVGEGVGSAVGMADG